MSTTLPPAGSVAKPLENQANEPPTLNTETLFKHQPEALIHHAGQVYRLRLTRQNKLILTK